MTDSEMIKKVFSADELAALWTASVVLEEYMRDATDAPQLRHLEVALRSALPKITAAQSPTQRGQLESAKAT